MYDLQEEYFSDSKLGGYSLADVGSGSMRKQPPEQWDYVRARTMTRTVGLYSESVCCVLKTTSGQPLARDRVETVSKNDLLQRMPRGPREAKAVPSPRGEYLTVVEVRGSADAEGTVTPRTSGRSSTIPVEFVIEPLSYDAAMVELIDQTL